MKNKAKYIVQVLRNHGFQGVFAGGIVRDMLLGKECNDIDIATDATPDQVEALFEKTIGVGKNFGVVVVVIDKEEFEIATFRSDSKESDGRRPNSVSFSSMEEDAKRRDFTINGMFYDPIEEKLIDLVGGQKDLENGVIQFIGDAESRIAEDHLRIVRGIRFAIRFGFEIEAETFAAIKKNADKVLEVSPERIQQELIKIMEIEQPGKAMELLFESGLMKYILPEVEAIKGIPQDPKWHQEGSVDIHTKMVLEGLYGCSINLKLAGLFHDIGKQKTTIIEDGRIKSPGHASVSAEMTFDIMKRLKFSNNITDYVVSLVRDHMKMIDLHKWRKAKQRKFLAQENFKDLLILHKADKMGRKGLFSVDSVKVAEDLLEKFASEPLKPDAYVSGRDLIAIGFTEEKTIGLLKSEIYDMQLEGEFVDRDAALAYAVSRFKGAI